MAQEIAFPAAELATTEECESNYIQYKTLRNMFINFYTVTWAHGDVLVVTRYILLTYLD